MLARRALAALALAGCQPDPSPAPADPTLTMAVTRPPGTTGLQLSGTAAQRPTLTTDCGAVLDLAFEAGTWTAAVEPERTGACELSAASGEDAVTITAVVFDRVDDHWDQPVSVEGLVNTPGWEDGASISPDGQWLFVHYITVPIDCIISFDPDDPTCRVAAGPWQAPERPGMPGAERIATDGTITHTCPDLGLDQPIGVPFPPISFYGFRRQADGSFDQPFPIFYDGASGCLSPFGISVVDQDPDQEPDQTTGWQATVWYTFDDPFDGVDPPQVARVVHQATIGLGQPSVLGTFRLEGGAATLAHGAEPLDLDFQTNAGNPNASEDPADQGVQVLWHDDETVAEADRDVYAYERRDGAWSAQVRLPVSQAGVEEIQPAFAAGRLYLRRGNAVVSHERLGLDLSQAASFGPERIDLSVGEEDTLATGSLVAVGEPTLTADGQELFFVYGVRAPDGTIDLEVGRVRARAD